MTPNDSPGFDQPSETSAPEACPSCGAAAPSEARFCSACGTSLEGSPLGRKWSAGFLAGLVAVAGLIAVVVFAVITYSERDSAPPAPTAAPTPLPSFDRPSAAPSGGAPDLSQMTPRQAADRLFNRIMMASEQGRRDEALGFVPMAVEAYGALPSLDRDALYHLGLIHGVADDRAKVEEQIAALRQGAPNHLLALVLEHGLAERAGDRDGASRALSALAAAYDAEIAIPRPEYEAHRNIIERLRATSAPAAPLPAATTGAPQGGAALFAAHCAACHGPDAAGSDKGPPLIHKIYEPSHHADAAFYRAVSQGVRAHHWQFGDMPPVPGVTESDAGEIIAYLRELQRAAGIE